MRHCFVDDYINDVIQILATPVSGIRCIPCRRVRFPPPQKKGSV